MLNLDATEDQILLRDTTARFLADHSPLSRVRELLDDPVGFDRQLLPAAAELGWFSLLVPEDRGGGNVSGRGVVDAAMIAEELGRSVQPWPFVSTNLVALAISMSERGAADEVLRSLLAGSAVGAWAVADATGVCTPAGLEGTTAGGAITLSGLKSFVQDGPSADWLLVAATVDGQPSHLLVPISAAGLSIELLDCFDLTRRMAAVRFDGVTVPEEHRLVMRGGPEATMERLLQVAVVLQCAETVGVIDSMFSTALQYAKDRIAFGRPIGSFQAIKHLLADMALQVETCKAGTAAALAAVQDLSPDAAGVASTVKSYVGDRAVDISQGCLQVSGGIGYTWEYDLHLFLRRASANRPVFGDPVWHRERLWQLETGSGSGGTDAARGAAA